jgi:hypothetical protein
VTFRDLRVGDVFHFDSELSWRTSTASGPWRKVSPRKYEHIDTGLTCHVGTVSVGVCSRQAMQYAGRGSA